MGVDIFTASERPELVEPAEAFASALWPKYLSTAASRQFWSQLYEAPLARFQAMAVDSESGEVVALGNSIPFVCPEGGRLPDEGWDWVLEAGGRAAETDETCDSLSALSVAIQPSRRGEGLAVKMLGAMKSAAREEGLASMVAPVRPTLKHLYPLHDFDTYCRWTTADGAPFDPWLRTHVKMGASFLRPALHSMTVTGTLDDWTGWTGLRFPQSGAYWLPGGLSALQVDLAAGAAIYQEPNYWMQHPL